MFVTNDHRLGFIHIPRTGGTSVTMSFALFPGSTTQVCRTHAHYSEYQGTDPTQWFATIRHPVARLHSGYYYQIEQDRKRVSRKLPLKSDLTVEFLQKRIDLFEEYGFEQTVVSADFNTQYRFLKQLHNIKSLNVLEQMQSICEYIKGCKNIVLFDIETQSTELFSWIKQNNPYINYTHVNRKNYKSNWRDKMSDKLIQYVKSNYHDDLTMFDYQL
jgi:hypothetical protein